MAVEAPKLRSDEERLEILRKIQLDAADPPGLDSDAVLKRALEAHRASRRKQIQLELESEVLHEDFQRRIGPSNEPMRDGLAVLAPAFVVTAICAVGMLIGVGQSSFAEIAGTSLVSVAIATLAAAGIAWGTSRWIRDRRGREVEFVHHTWGALLGGCAMAGLLVVSWTQRAEERQDLALQLAEERLSNVVLDRALADLAAEAPIASVLNGIEIEQSADKVRYTASAGELEGRVVAEVSADGDGAVQWTSGAESQVLRRIAFGRVARLDANSELVLVNANGESREFRFATANASPAVKLGSTVGVLLDTSPEPRVLRAIAVAE